MMNKQKHWYDYLYLWSILYFTLGFFNILFAWLGLIDFLVPLIFAIYSGNKNFCNRYCGRGQLLQLLGSRLKLSQYRSTPGFISGKYFRYGFLIFFLTMFSSMLLQTYLVASQAASLKEVLNLLWIFQVPWHFAYPIEITGWIAQFSFGFYNIMLTSTIMGLIAMLLWKLRSWCTFCPMGTMTQLICKAKNAK